MNTFQKLINGLCSNFCMYLEASSWLKGKDWFHGKQWVGIGGHYFKWSHLEMGCLGITTIIFSASSNCSLTGK